MNGEAKENANPVIHSVEEKNRSHEPLAPLQRWAAGESVADRAVFQVFKDSEDGLLKHVGLTPFSSFQQGFGFTSSAHVPEESEGEDKIMREPFDADEIYENIRNIQDPEHPLTLEQLNVVNRKHVEVIDSWGIENVVSKVDVRFTPTIPHCSMATLIGLCLKVKLLRSLPSRFDVTVRIQPGTHASERAINKQLADKERVAAALENTHLLGVVNRCIESGITGELQQS